MSKEENENDWVEIRLPSSVCSGPRQILHQYKVNDKWSVIIFELSIPEGDEGGMMVAAHGMPPMMAQRANGRSRWSVIFEDNEVAVGSMDEIMAAKNVAMTVLESLMKGPEPKPVAENPLGKLGH